MNIGWKDSSGAYWRGEDANEDPDFLGLGVMAIEDESGWREATDEDRKALLRTELHERRRARRTQAETAGFTHTVGTQSYRIDSDRDSILRISNATNAALTAIITQSAWGTVWKCADNSELPVDAAGMLAMQISLAVHGQMCHTRSQELEAEIDDATADLAVLAAIDIDSGWPE